MNLTKISKFISLILRHDPGVINVEIDNNGWVPINTLIAGLNNKGYKIDKSILNQIVKTDNKGRYSFDDSGTKIRAVQGHSLPNVRIEFEKKIPPSILYHGTSVASLEVIQDEGLKRMTRQYVHLTGDYDTALETSRRRKIDKHCIILIDAYRMHTEGYDFYKSENNVWLIRYIPPNYFKEIDYV